MKISLADRLNKRSLIKIGKTSFLLKQVGLPYRKNAFISHIFRYENLLTTILERYIEQNYTGRTDWTIQGEAGLLFIGTVKKLAEDCDHLRATASGWAALGWQKI